MEEVSYMVCMRVDELETPVEESTKTACVECGDDIWISAASRKHAGEVGAFPVCSRCALRLAKENPTEMREFGSPSDQQFEEIMQALRNNGFGELVDAALDPEIDTFDGLKKTASLAGQAMTDPKDDWGSVVLMEDYNGITYPPVALDKFFDRGVPKEIIAQQLIPGLVQTSRAKRVIYGISAWSITAEKDSPIPEGSLGDLPDSKEQLVLIEVTADGVTRFAHAEILRDGINPPKLGEWDETEAPEGSDGLFIASIVPVLQLIRSQQPAE